MNACAGRRLTARPLVPLPEGGRAALAGTCLAVGVALQVRDSTTLGAVLVACAALAATLRRPSPATTVRGPGRWRVLRPADAFAPDGHPSHWLDSGTSAGRATAIATAAGVLVAGILAFREGAGGAWLVALDAVVFLPILVTGCPSQWPLRQNLVGCAWLGRAYRRLCACEPLRVAPWGRVTLDGSLDEVRVLVLPRVAMPGLVGIEVGMASANGTVGEVVAASAAPELLVRVLEGTPAATQLARLLPGTRAVVGRRSDERVVRVIPAVPAKTTAPALARALAEALSDRRAEVSAPDWAGRERRAPPKPAPSRTIPRVEQASNRTC